MSSIELNEDDRCIRHVPGRIHEVKGVLSASECIQLIAGCGKRWISTLTSVRRRTWSNTTYWR